MTWILLALVLGGVLKGATGAGSPIIAVPVIAMFYDVPLAIAIFMVPNLVSNVWQFWAHRRDVMPWAFTLRYAIAGGLGAGLGTVLLARLSAELLLLLVALTVFAYIAFRVLRPDWLLRYETARMIVLPVGAIAGALQGAAGVSAPVSITFLNAMRPERSTFIATISFLFVAMTVVQIPALAHYGILTAERLLWSCAALVPLMGAMPIGAALARRVSRTTFDRVILILLAAIALRLIWQAAA